jgi:plasmid stabilization system protein ParE
MNCRHAFDLTKRSPQARRHNTYEYLKHAFGDRAANVLLNAWFVVFYPLAGGVWDSAFEETGNRPAGFDFKGSPFGDDPFDLFPFQPEVRGKLRYRDVLTGFVYVNPIESQYREIGVPGLYKGFEKEALRRAELVSDDYRRAIEGLIASEKMGSVPMKDAMPNRAIESLLELSLLGVSGVGLMIELAVFALGWRRGKSQ